MRYDLTILPDNKDSRITGTETILEASLAAGVPHAHACGGNGKCSSCRILVVKGVENCLARTENERILANTLGFDDTMRLACQTSVSGPVTVKRAILDEVDMELLDHDFQNLDTKKSLGKEINATLLFADIEGYTEVTEKALPFDVVHMLNRYYLLMGKTVGNHKGQIMDYFGDGFLAIFGLNDNKNHAEQAVRAGLAMQEQMKKMNPYFNNLFGRNFKVRIGINTGSVILGSIGIEGMQKLAAIGDAVNLASRIEAVNKTLRTTFLISDTTLEKVKHAVRPINSHKVELKGKRGTYVVHEL